MKEAILLARESGIGYVGCRHSNHFGAAAPYVLLACQERMIGIAGSNACTLPWVPGGVSRGLSGTTLSPLGSPVKEISFSARHVNVRCCPRKNQRHGTTERKDSGGMGTGSSGETDHGSGGSPEGVRTSFWSIQRLRARRGCGHPERRPYGWRLFHGCPVPRYHWEEPTNVGHFFVVIDATRFMSLEVLSERMKRMYHNLRGAPR